ncbi:hypothetical protein HMPREF0541_02373 [Lacticaseibacillus rhamnosus ATCC 21052]|nr:hypothetical protein HMPREF0541_02373 [Lacticaseibacillus rhamnosus ATCC 21052]
MANGKLNASQSFASVIKRFSELLTRYPINCSQNMRIFMHFNC